MIFNTLSRSVANWSYVDRGVARWYSLGAVPAAAVGSIVFVSLPTELLARGLGLFLLALVAYRHLPIAANLSMPLRGFLPVWDRPRFLLRHLRRRRAVRRAFLHGLRVEKECFRRHHCRRTFLVSITKASVYGGFSLLDAEALHVAVGIGLIMAVGGLHRVADRQTHARASVRLHRRRRHACLRRSVAGSGLAVDPVLAIGLGVAAFLAAVIGGLAGLGSAIIMIPVLTFAVGIREAVPIANLGRDDADVVARLDQPGGHRLGSRQVVLRPERPLPRYWGRLLSRTCRRTCCRRGSACSCCSSWHTDTPRWGRGSR